MLDKKDKGARNNSWPFDFKKEKNMIDYKNNDKYTEAENIFLQNAIETLDIGILDICKIKIARPERLADILITIGRHYAEITAEDDEPIW